MLLSKSRNPYKPNTVIVSSWASWDELRQAEMRWAETFLEWEIQIGFSGDIFIQMEGKTLPNLLINTRKHLGFAQLLMITVFGS